MLSFTMQLQSSSSDEAISSKADKLPEKEEVMDPRTSVEIKEEAMEKIKKAQRQIQLENFIVPFELLS